LEQLGIAPVARADLGSMHNVWVSGDVWIGSHPTPADLDLAHRRGIATAIDLTPLEEGLDDVVAATCAKLGITHVTLDIRRDHLIPNEAVDRVLAELSKPDRGPVLMFCGDGSRAAMMFAIWRVLHDGVGIEEALVEARRSGMKPGVPESFVRLQIARWSQSPEWDRRVRATRA
jgi:protein tyrosine phosphatase (PTP) superfamily phosphohydrolase (DUF442 family)